MEVHAHIHTERKRFKHYLWEFLMLFLAVFCGFLAENQREHMVERRREKQYILSLTYDIKADINHLNTIIDNKRKREIQLDSLTLLLNAPGNKETGNSIYYLAIQVSRRIATLFTPNNGTMQQLKNAGLLRLIRKRVIVDSITKYDVSTRNLETLGEIENISLESFRTTAAKFFNSLEFEKMLDEENNVSRPTNNPRLFAYTKTDLDEINYKLHRLKFNNRGSMREAKKLLKQAINFLSVLKREYHLE
jgi:hypothetical protein